MKSIEKILEDAGVKINGNNPWDPQVKDPKVLSMILSGGALALAETYVDKLWDVEDFVELFLELLDTPKLMIL